MRLVDRMYLHPRKCIICRHGKEAVDTNKTLGPGPTSLRNARIYVCLDCVGRLAKTAGFTSIDAAMKLQDELKATQEESDAIKADLESAQKVIASYDALKKVFASEPEKETADAVAEV